MGYIPVFPALGRLSQEVNEFEASLGDSMKFCLIQGKKITDDTCIKVIISS